jgi:AAA family ATP:ADP antiporter
MVERVRRWLDIRPGEGWPVLCCALYIALAVASFLLAKPIRNGLFLHEFGPYKLVYAYVGVPLVLAAFVPLYEAIAARIGQRLVITASLLFLCANVLAFWWGFRRDQTSWLAAAFYVWVNCYGVIAPVQAWSFANSVFDTRQARRLFGVVGAGASLGAILGGLLARVLVGPLGTVNLLLVLAALIAATAVLVNIAWGVRRRRARPRKARPRHPLTGALALIGRTRYLRLMAALVALVAIVTQWTSFQFNVVVAERFTGDADGITRFMGAFNLVMGIVSFGVQLALTGPLLRSFGLSVTLLLLPIALCTGSLLTVVWPVLLPVLLTNTLDQGLRFSVDKASFELLYLPVSPAIRPPVKSAIDLVVNRLADGLGGILLGLATQGFGLVAFSLPGAGLGLRGLATLSVTAGALWGLVAWKLRRGYVEAIRESIQEHRIDTVTAAAPMLDRSATELLGTKLQAGDTEEILYALDVLGTQVGGRMHPAVRGLLSHPAAAVRRRALALLDEAADTGATNDVQALLRDPDVEIRTEALLFLAHHAQVDPLSVLPRPDELPWYSIQAAMIGFLVRPGPLQNLEAAPFLIDNLIDEQAGASTASRLEAARLLGSLPVSFDAQLTRLIDDPDPDVAREALVAAGRTQSTVNLARLVDHLGHRATRADAAAALLAFGPVAAAALGASLGDEGLPLDVRREIPALLARLGTVEAQRALYENLLVTDVGLRSSVIAALAALHEAQPGLAIDRQTVEMVMTAEILGHYRSYQILDELADAFATDHSIIDGLRQSIRQENERIFGLVGLLSPDRDVEQAYAAMQSDDAVIRANALELLDNVLSPDLRRLVVPLVDPQVSFDQRVALANTLVGASVQSREEAVQALIASEDPWLRSYGVYAVGALGLTSMAGELERLAGAGDALLRETVRAARVRLASPPGPLPPPGGPQVQPSTPEDTGIFDVRDVVGLG